MLNSVDSTRGAPSCSKRVVALDRERTPRAKRQRQIVDRPDSVIVVSDEEEEEGDAAPVVARLPLQNSMPGPVATVTGGRRTRLSTRSSRVLSEEKLPLDKVLEVRPLCHLA
jgi:hypothetical protein